MQVQATTLSDEVMATDEGQILSEEEEIVQPPADVPLDSIPPVAMSEGLQQEMATERCQRRWLSRDADFDDDECNPDARRPRHSAVPKSETAAAAIAIAAAAASS